MKDAWDGISSKQSSCKTLEVFYFEPTHKKNNISQQIWAVESWSHRPVAASSSFKVLYGLQSSNIYIYQRLACRKKHLVGSIASYWSVLCIMRQATTCLFNMINGLRICIAVTGNKVTQLQVAQSLIRNVKTPLWCTNYVQGHWFISLLPGRIISI